MTLTSTFISTTGGIVQDGWELIFLYGAVGDDSTTPTSAGTALINETFRSAVDGFVKSGVSKVTASLRISANENNGSDIKEIGWFDASSDGNMHLRDTITTISKTSDIQVFIDTTITIAVQVW